MKPERPVLELGFGVVVYPPREEGGRWRSVWYEDGQRRQCQSLAEDQLAAKLEKVKARLALDAPNMARPGADLIGFYLDPDRLPIDRRWSRSHASLQQSLCERVRSTLSALVNAGIDAGYLANPRLAKVHWQAGDRAVPEAAATVAGEPRLWVDPAEIPSAADVGGLGRALTAGRRGAGRARRRPGGPGWPGDLGEPEGR
jgi:hypothetical protein